MFKYILILLSFLFSYQGSAQTHTGKWRDHFSYRNCKLVAEGEQLIAAASAMGLILVEKETFEFETVSKVNGLHDDDVSALANIGNDKFIIGYKNGNIDIVNEDEIINIPDFKIKNIQGSKSINHFHLVDNFAYCSTDYALLVIDIQNQEIYDTYFLGLNSQNLIIHETMSIGNEIYAATDRGLLKADINDPQISYFEAWERISTSSNSHYAIQFYNSTPLTVKKLSNGSFQLDYLDNNYWKTLRTFSNFSSLQIKDQDIILTQRSRVDVCDIDTENNLVINKTIDSYNFEDQLAGSVKVNQLRISDAFNLQDGTFIFADNYYGFVISNNVNDISLIPSGPFSNSCNKLLATKEGVYTVAGGQTIDLNNLGKHIEFSFFNHRDWSYFYSHKKGKERNWWDLIGVCEDKNSDKVYMNSWGSGIFDVSKSAINKHYDHTNSGLVNIYGDNNPKYVRVGGLDIDREGNVWMSNASVTEGIKVLSISNGNEVWKSYTYKTLNDLHSVRQLFIDSRDYVWVIIPRTNNKGLMVINTKGVLDDDSEHIYKSPESPSGLDNRNVGQLQLWDENQREITKTIYCITEDKNGYIWLGTDKGVLVYYHPWSIFSEQYPVANRIKVPRNDGSGLADYLLDKETVTTIAVDGANRKWLGTEKGGAFLVSEDGLKTYHSFNKDNSPLPSNNITSISIDPISGEVYIGTDKGIVSFKGKANEGNEKLNKIHVYPNPVRESFNGDITIGGLMKDCQVKITTTSGRLVYETRSLGGKAYWDGRNFSGEKVSTGVYIIYANSEDGAESAMTKLLIVR